MNRKPLVSVITVCLNSERFIQDTLESVLRQTYENMEYIIIDGKSTDKTVEIVRSYKAKFQGRMTLVIDENASMVSSWNRGIEISRGDIIGFLNSDDYYVTASAVEKIAETFSVHDNIDACYSDILLVDRWDVRKKRRLWIAPLHGFLSDFRLGWAPAHPSFYASRKAYTAFGNYDPFFKIAADFELMCRFVHKGKINLVHLPTVLINMREGGISNSHFMSVIRGNRECYLALKKNGLFPYLIFLKPLRKFFHMIRVRFLSGHFNSDCG